jgi:aspartate aminotransferase-like enzyme
MLVVDAITSLAVHPLPQDDWGVDVVVCGSQKGLMIPPGLATVSLAPWAAGAIEGERLPRFYFDLRKYRKSAPLGETPFTPPVSLVPIPPDPTEVTEIEQSILVKILGFGYLNRAKLNK